MSIISFEIPRRFYVHTLKQNLHSVASPKSYWKPPHQTNSIVPNRTHFKILNTEILKALNIYDNYSGSYWNHVDKCSVRIVREMADVSRSCSTESQRVKYQNVMYWRSVLINGMALDLDDTYLKGHINWHFECKSELVCIFFFLLRWNWF